MMASSSTDSKTRFWQHLSRNDKANKIINEGFLTDCKFVVGPENGTTETIHGIKLFFIMESPVFEKMFRDNYEEAQEKSEIRLTDVSPKDFKNLSLMIYTHFASNLNTFLLDEILTLYRLCDKYMFSSILQLCINHMKNADYLNKVSINGLITLFEFARDLEDKFLLQCIRLIMQKRCTIPINRTNSLTEEAFYEYVQILRDSRANFYTTRAEKELHILLVIESYFTSNNLLKLLHNDKCELTTKYRIQTLRQNLLKLVQFSSISLNEFKDFTFSSKLLDNEQKCYIMCLISKCRCGHHDN